MVKNGVDVSPEQEEELPSFYWLPKLHKRPYGTRFIAASNKCTTKQLSSLLTSCFKTILIHYKEYCEGICRHTGVNCYWIVDNSKEVLNRLHNVLIMFHRLNVLIVTILPRCIQIFHMKV